MSDQRVLVIGATGLIGRPVTEQLVKEGITVRVLARRPRRARAVLPDRCEVVPGDLRDEASLDAALRGMDAVYLSLANAMTFSRPAWDADADGTLAVLAAVRRTGVPRLLRLSAMGIAETNGDWWVARVKRDVDQALLDSDVASTIFRPTWLMESLAVSAVGPFLVTLPAPDDPLCWLAGEDLGRQVAAALRTRDSENVVYVNQGPEGVSMRDACRRFRRVWRRYLLAAPMPGVVVTLGAKFVPQLAYVKALLRMTYETVDRAPRANGHDLHEPTMTIEDFATKLLDQRLYPVKSTR
ncbi:MAG: NAD(P)H-binding protein [Planctomycetes bacterium]|nr:NAD(P)H-binding protein [Planctomycetota bacterium]